MAMSSTCLSATARYSAVTRDAGLIGREGDALMPAAHLDDDALADAAASLMRGGALAGFRLNAPVHDDAAFLLDGEKVVARFNPCEGADEPLADVLIAQGGQVWRLAPWRADGAGGADASDGAILSPMPGRIIAVAVSAELNARKGGQVSEGMSLVKADKAVALYLSYYPSVMPWSAVLKDCPRYLISLG